VVQCERKTFYLLFTPDNFRWTVPYRRFMLIQKLFVTKAAKNFFSQHNNKIGVLKYWLPADHLLSETYQSRPDLAHSNVTTLSLYKYRKMKHGFRRRENCLQKLLILLRRVIDFYWTFNFCTCGERSWPPHSLVRLPLWSAVINRKRCCTCIVLCRVWSFLIFLIFLLSLSFTYF
jgi:hypothetical protein